MRLLRKRLIDLNDHETIMFRALAAEWEQLTEDICQETHVRVPDFLALTSATRDRRLVIELLRQHCLPPLASYCCGPDEYGEDLILREAAA
jgi:hypothetical protein